MTRFHASPRFRRRLPDLIAGLTVFALMVGLTGWHIGIATASDGTLAASLDRNASAVLLAGAFAAMTVFNVAFVRHLRRAYAPQTRRSQARADRSVARDRP